MRLLDRYLLREFLVPLSYCLGGFLTFWISANLFAQLDEFQKRKLGLGDVVEYYVVGIPEILVTILPVALLLALLYTLTNHARYNELTAMRAAGISLWRLSAPYMVVGVFFSITLFVLNEWAVPNSQERTEEIMNRRGSGAQTDAAGPDWKRNLYFRNEPDRRSWKVSAYNTKTFDMTGTQIIWDLPDGGRREIYAERGAFVAGSWIFYNCQQSLVSTQSIFPEITSTNLLRMDDFRETPELIHSEIKVSNLSLSKAARGAQLSIGEIMNYFRLHPQISGNQRAVLDTQLHGRIAMAWTCIIVVLIALPFGAASGRRNVFVGVASSIFICFTFFIVQRFSLSLGVGGFLPPWLAAWLPNLLFGIAGAVMTLRVR